MKITIVHGTNDLSPNQVEELPINNVEVCRNNAGPRDAETWLTLSVPGDDKPIWINLDSALVKAIYLAWNHPDRDI